MKLVSLRIAPVAGSLITMVNWQEKLTQLGLLVLSVMGTELEQLVLAKSSEVYKTRL